MNHYGAQAMTHWRTYLPTRFAQITDPEVVLHRARGAGGGPGRGADPAADGRRPAAELGRAGSFLDKAARINTAKRMAEQRISRSWSCCPRRPNRRPEPGTGSGMAPTPR